MNVLFSVDELLNNPSLLTGGYTTHSVQRAFFDTVMKKAYELKSTSIITNGNIASVLMDLMGFAPKVGAVLQNKGMIYPFGNIGHLQLFVDPYQKWTDNYIKFGSEILTRKLKLKKISGTLTEQEKILGGVYIGYLIDTQGLLVWLYHSHSIVPLDGLNMK